jgi:hypothetical protein
MRLLSLFAVAMAGLIAMPALAQTPTPDGTPTRVRGTVEKLDGHNLTVKSRKPGDFVASTGIKDKDVVQSRDEGSDASSLCNGDGVRRRRSVPRGTVG